MKEIVKKIIVGILAVGIVVGAAVYRFVIYPKNKEETTTTDVSVSDTSATQEDKETTNKPKEEKTTKAEKDENTTTSENKQDDTDAVSESEASTEENTQAASEENQPSESTPESQNSAENTPTPQKPVETVPTPQKPADNNPTPQQPVQNTTEEEIIDDSEAEGNLIDPYQQLFKSGKFVMEVNDPELGPVKMAMSGNKMFIEASMEGIELKMVHNGSTNKGKLVEGWAVVLGKIYSPMPADMVGDMNVEELTKDFAAEDNTVYTPSVEEITLNGETAMVNVESCVDSNGNTTKYYFDGDVLVRSDSISPDGSVSTTEFTSISADVPDDLFVFPAGSVKMDFSGLLGELEG